MNKRVEFDTEHADTLPDHSALTDHSKLAPLLSKKSVSKKPVSNRSSDQILVNKVQSGDKRSFDLLVLKYQPKVTKLVARWVKDYHDVEDITQEVFIKAYKGLKIFRGDSAFYTWLYRIAVNTAKTHVITATRRPIDNGIDDKYAEQFLNYPILQDIADPQSELEADNISSTIEGTIVDLPADLRTAIILREISGFTYEKIAESMDCPIGTIRSRIFRARTEINQQLRPLIDNPDNTLVS